MRLDAGQRTLKDLFRREPEEVDFGRVEVGEGTLERRTGVTSPDTCDTGSWTVVSGSVLRCRKMPLNGAPAPGPAGSLRVLPEPSFKAPQPFHPGERLFAPRRRCGAPDSENRWIETAHDAARVNILWDLCRGNPRRHRWGGLDSRHGGFATTRCTESPAA